MPDGAILVGEDTSGTPGGITIDNDWTFENFLAALADTLNAAITWVKPLKNPRKFALKVGAVVLTQVWPNHQRFLTDNPEIGEVVDLLNLIDEASRGLDITDLPLGAVAKRILAMGVVEIIDDSGRVIATVSRYGGVAVDPSTFYGGDP